MLEQHLSGICEIHDIYSSVDIDQSNMQHEYRQEAGTFTRRLVPCKAMDSK